MTIIYKIIQINGEYAIIESGNNGSVNVAMALLPENINEGDTILFENFEYTKI